MEQQINLLNLKAELDNLHTRVKRLEDMMDSIYRILTKHQDNWEFLIKELKPYIERQEGLENYISNNLSPTLRGIENNLEAKKGTKKQYDPF